MTNWKITPTDEPPNNGVTYFDGYIISEKLKKNIAKLSHELQEGIKTTLEHLKQHNYASVHLKNLTNSSARTLRINETHRISLTPIEYKGYNFALIHGIIVNHDFKKAKDTIINDQWIARHEASCKEQLGKDPFFANKIPSSSLVRQNIKDIQLATEAFSRQKFIELTEDQYRVASETLPLILSGPPGVGKTILQEILLDGIVIHTSDAENALYILFITATEHLAHHLASEWKKNAPKTKHIVEFVSYKEWFKTQGYTNIVPKDHFEKWYNDYRARKNSPLASYSYEIYGLTVYSTFKMFADSTRSARDFLFPIEEMDAFEIAYKEYRKSLGEYINPDLHMINPSESQHEGYKQPDFIFIDEAQLLTFTQILNLYQTAKYIENNKKAIALNYGSHQILNYHISHLERVIKYMHTNMGLAPKHISLTGNHRSHRDIVQWANAFAGIKYELVEGVADRFEVNAFHTEKLSNTDVSQVTLIDELTEETVELFKTGRWLVLTDDAQLEEARAICGNALTYEQAIGLEADYVFLYNPFSHPAFKKMHDDLSEAKPHSEEVSMPLHKPKKGYQNKYYIPHVNNLISAIQRGREGGIIFQTKIQWFHRIRDRLPKTSSANAVFNNQALDQASLTQKIEDFIFNGFYIQAQSEFEMTNYEKKFGMDFETFKRNTLINAESSTDASVIQSSVATSLPQKSEEIITDAIKVQNIQVSWQEVQQFYSKMKTEDLDDILKKGLLETYLHTEFKLGKGKRQSFYSHLSQNNKKKALFLNWLNTPSYGDLKKEAIDKIPELTDLNNETVGKTSEIATKPQDLNRGSNLLVDDPTMQQQKMYLDRAQKVLDDLQSIVSQANYKNHNYTHEQFETKLQIYRKAVESQVHYNPDEFTENLAVNLLGFGGEHELCSQFMLNYVEEFQDTNIYQIIVINPKNDLYYFILITPDSPKLSLTQSTFAAFLAQQSSNAILVAPCLNITLPCNEFPSSHLQSLCDKNQAKYFVSLFAFPRDTQWDRVKSEAKEIADNIKQFSDKTLNRFSSYQSNQSEASQDIYGEFVCVHLLRKYAKKNPNQVSSELMTQFEKLDIEKQKNNLVYRLKLTPSKNLLQFKSQGYQCVEQNFSFIVGKALDPESFYEGTFENNHGQYTLKIPLTTTKTNATGLNIYWGSNKKIDLGDKAYMSLNREIALGLGEQKEVKRYVIKEIKSLDDLFYRSRREYKKLIHQQNAIYKEQQLRHKNLLLGKLLNENSETPLQLARKALERLVLLSPMNLAYACKLDTLPSESSPKNLIQEERLAASKLQLDAIQQDIQNLKTYYAKISAICQKITPADINGSCSESFQLYLLRMEDIEKNYKRLCNRFFMLTEDVITFEESSQIASKLKELEIEHEQHLLRCIQNILLFSDERKGAFDNLVNFSDRFSALKVGILLHIIRQDKADFLVVLLNVTFSFTTMISQPSASGTTVIDHSIGKSVFEMIIETEAIKCLGKLTASFTPLDLLTIGSNGKQLGYKILHMVPLNPFRKFCFENIVVLKDPEFYQKLIEIFKKQDDKKAMIIADIERQSYLIANEKDEKNSYSEQEQVVYDKMLDDPQNFIALVNLRSTFYLIKDISHYLTLLSERRPEIANQLNKKIEDYISPTSYNYKLLKSALIKLKQESKNDFENYFYKYRVVIEELFKFLYWYIIELNFSAENSQELKMASEIRTDYFHRFVEAEIDFKHDGSTPAAQQSKEEYLNIFSGEPAFCSDNELLVSAPVSSGGMGIY